ncbi:MAG: PadR family transcriptional regulator [Actinophytocola sp.]|uniref:PadR family transcriptional regulator n=1 Tax=Actinophytocola sp. TaxID=1872138 RepID=UPI001324C67A|nr:PadR family transcriptional regulator [Actinophytocola sp.]MPZ86039.1 PadR family transcriptional regulator [Actinophytocola sp.]
MSATRLLVLGVVRMYGQAHGYQVRRELLTWSADKWGNTAPGSIYHALRKMAREKLLEEVETGAEGRGPDRTAYQLTPDGETEFQVLLAKSLSEYDDGTQAGYALAAAVTFITALPRARAIGLLRHRINQMEGSRTIVAIVLEHGVDWGHPQHVEELYRLWDTSLDAVLGWARGLVVRLEAGEYVMADDAAGAFGQPGSATS